MVGPVVSKLVGCILGLLSLERLKLGRGGGQLDELAVDLVRGIGAEVGIEVEVGLGLGVGVGLAACFSFDLSIFIALGVEPSLPA